MLIFMKTIFTCTFKLKFDLNYESFYSRLQTNSGFCIYDIPPPTPPICHLYFAIKFLEFALQSGHTIFSGSLYKEQKNHMR